MKEHIIKIDNELCERLACKAAYTTSAMTLANECAEGIRISCADAKSYYVTTDKTFVSLFLHTQEAMDAAIADKDKTLENYFQGEAEKEHLDEVVALIEEACAASEVACEFQLKRTSEGEGELGLWVGEAKLGALACVTFNDAEFNAEFSRQNPMDAEGGAE